MNEIILDPILPLPVLFGIGLLIVGLTLWSILRAARGVWFRTAGAVIVFAGLFNPQVTTQDTQALKDIAIVLVDQSSSQTLHDRVAQTQKAKDYIAKESAHYSDLEVRFIDIVADGREDKLGTRALATLQQSLSGIDPKRFAGTVLISDGQIHDVEDFNELPGPFHLILTGSKKDKDRRLEILDAPRYGLVGDTLTIRLRVLDNGKPVISAPLSITTPDGALHNLSANENSIYEFEFAPEHAGLSVLVAETETLDGEISTANNKIALSINGVRDRLRVLLVSGLPHQGQRTWRNILRSDPAVDLVHFTILRPSEKEDFTPLNELSLIAFPVRELFEEKLEDFDLIIFDRYYKHNVLSEGYFDNIAEYVQEGGALLVSTGPDFSGPRSLAETRLNKVLPVEPSGVIAEDRPFRLHRSPVGKRHPITTRLAGKEEDWGRWLRLVETKETSGQTILQNDENQPVLIVERIKEGRIAMLLSDHVWLWARGFDGGGPHADLVRHLVHWLMKEPDLEEEKLSLHTVDNATLEINRQSLAEAHPKITLTRPDGSEELVDLKVSQFGAATARVRSSTPGIYKASDGEKNALITVGSLNPKEFLDPRASEEPLKAIIKQTGGTIHWINDGLPTLKRVAPQGNVGGREWFGLTQNKAEAIIGLKSAPMLPAWMIFVAALLCWVMGWWRESR